MSFLLRRLCLSIEMRHEYVSDEIRFQKRIEISVSIHISPTFRASIPFIRNRLNKGELMVKQLSILGMNFLHLQFSGVVIGVCVC